jgi:hypothetical protein
VSLAELQRELVLAGAGVLGEGSLADAEDFVADLEPGHRRAECDDRAGDIEPRNRVLGLAQPGSHQAEQVWESRHQVPRASVEPCSVHSNQYLVVSDRGSVDLLRVEHVSGAVGPLHDRLHRVRAVNGRRWRRPVVEGWLLHWSLRSSFNDRIGTICGGPVLHAASV